MSLLENETIPFVGPRDMVMAMALSENLLAVAMVLQTSVAKGCNDREKFPRFQLPTVFMKPMDFQLRIHRRNFGDPCQSLDSFHSYYCGHSASLERVQTS